MTRQGMQFGCPLCKHEKTALFHEDAHRPYVRCENCHLVFVPPPYWIGVREERAVYDCHENDPRDPGYRRFLSRLTVPLLERIGRGKKGLDFGCGPGPALPAMLAEKGHRVLRYDPLYHDDPAVLAQTYEFICATEVVEHLRDPDAVFAKLFDMLARRGWLGVMTKLVIDRSAFARWHYIRDTTHICFYSRDTFAYIARRFHANLEFIAADAMLLCKNR